ncbi:MAG: DUF5652 family protein [Patescibacteria group bacterium]
MSPFINDNPIILLILVLWTLPWKIYALWLAVKNNHKGWFVALVILNTFGIVEIIYIFAVAKKKWADVKKTLLNFLSPKK